ncbi:MAG: class I SAM-dependent methyltransferase, partial [Thermoanaerobaculia bacterium]
AVDWPARLALEGPFLLAALAAAPSRRVVDLGSATGEHARWLAGKGFEVVGIEGMKERWELARQLTVPGVEFLIGDLGAVEAMVRGQFGAATCLGNTLPALIGAEAVSRMFIGLRRRFLPGGVLVLQQWNFDGLARRGVRELPERRMAQAESELVFRAGFELEADGIATIHERTYRLNSPSVEVKSAPADGGSAAGEWQLLHERHRYLQGWTHSELLTLLDLARFREVRVYGGFAGEPFDLDLSDELVVVAS